MLDAVQVHPCDSCRGVAVDVLAGAVLQRQLPVRKLAAFNTAGTPSADASGTDHCDLL